MNTPPTIPDDEREAMDAWFAEKGIYSLADLTAYIGSEVSQGILDDRDEVGDALDEDVVADKLPAALASALEDAGDLIAAEAKADTLWLHSLAIAERLLDHPKVVAVLTVGL